MAKQAQLLDRKDIARMLEISVRSVARHEKRWGLVQVRINSRVIKYDAQATLRTMKERRLILG